jgi:hypothetical protein
MSSGVAPILSLFVDRWRGRFILRHAQDEVVYLAVDAVKNPTLMLSFLIPSLSRDEARRMAMQRSFGAQLHSFTGEEAGVRKPR